MKIVMADFSEKSKIAVVLDMVSNYSKNKIADACLSEENVFFVTENDVNRMISKRTCKPDLSNAEVIFQDNNTVLKLNGKTYIAKPEKGEKYDQEKGLLICLMKAFGISTTDFLKILESGKIMKKECKTVKCDKKKVKGRK